jgi:hypothetical protein
MKFCTRKPENRTVCASAHWQPAIVFAVDCDRPGSCFLHLIFLASAGNPPDTLRHRQLKAGGLNERNNIIELGNDTRNLFLAD